MKFLKTAGIVIISAGVLFYSGLVLIVPKAVNLNKMKADIQKAAAESAGLNIDYNDARIVVTPSLSAGIEASGIKINFKDGADFLSASSVKTAISLPRLLFKEIKVTKAEAVSPKINIDIINGKEYRLIKYLDELAQQQKDKPEQEKNSFDISSVKINIPQVKIADYALLLNDLKTNDCLKLRGDELFLSYKDGKTASVKTIAELFLNETKNITADIDIDTFIPAAAETASETGAAQEAAVKTEQPQFINPIAVYKTYNLKADTAAKLKIRQKDDLIVSDGNFNIDNLTLILSGLKLPKSSLHADLSGTNVNADTELYIAENEKISIKADGDYGKNQKLNVKIKSDEIYAASALELVKAVLYSANIPNELGNYKSSGSFTADTEFRTDFKSLKSSGSIIFKDINIKENNKQIAEINSKILLDNSMLNITDTVIKAFDAVFTASGTINEKAEADIKIVMDKMPLDKVFNLAAPADITKVYAVNSGVLNLAADITGELKNLNGSVQASIRNAAVKDKANGINYSNSLLTADFKSDFKTFKGVINNSGFKLSMNGADIGCDKLAVNAGDKDLIINPAVIKINNNTNINVKGTVKNYLTNPVFNINMDGSLRTADLKQLAGSDIAVYLKSKGVIPLSAEVSGDAEKQTVKASITADADNYITFADIKNIAGRKSSVNTVIEIKDNKVSIKDTGLFSEGVQIAAIDGTVSRINTKDPVLNALNIKIPNDIEASLAVFPQSKFTVKGSAAASGTVNNPKFRGGFSIFNASIPELYLTLGSASAKFEDKNLDIELKKLDAAGSDFNIIINSDLMPVKNNFVIKNLNIISNYLDADKVMKVSDALNKYTAPAASSSASSSAQNAPALIPVIIKDGSIDMKEIKSGNIHLTDTAGRISMSDNVFYIKNLASSAFKGKLKGDVSVNLVNSAVTADVKGSGMDAAQALLEAAAMKDTLSGALDFDADISLKGASYEEQVKSLKGSVDFLIKDGSLGPMGRIENLVSADNISGSSALKTLVNSALSSTVDTSKFSLLKGHLDFNKGIAQIKPITSSGDYMSTYIAGSFDILKNTADMKLRGRLGSRVTDSMGQLAALNPVNIINSNDSISMVLGSLMLTMCEKVTDAELAEIPEIAKESSGNNAAEFQAVIRGDAAKPLKLVRSFKWLASETQIKEAKEKLSGRALISVPSNAAEAKQQAKDILKNLSSESTQQMTQQGKEAVNALKSIFNSVKDAQKQE